VLEILATRITLQLHSRLLHELPWHQLHDFQPRGTKPSEEVWTRQATEMYVTAVGTYSSQSLTEMVGSFVIITCTRAAPIDQYV